MPSPFALWWHIDHRGSPAIRQCTRTYPVCLRSETSRIQLVFSTPYLLLQSTPYPCIAGSGGIPYPSACYGKSRLYPPLAILPEKRFLGCSAVFVGRALFQR